MSPFPVCPVIFCLNLNQALLLLSSGKSIIFPYCLNLVHLYSIATNLGCLQINITIFYWIIHRHYYINILSITYLCVIYFSYAVGKRSTIFNYYFFICITYSCPCSCCVWNCYSSFSKYVCVAIITLEASQVASHCFNIFCTTVSCFSCYFLF